MRSRVLTSIAAVITLVAASASTAAAAEPRVAKALWNCVASVDDPHQSHTNAQRVTVHADFKSCSKSMPEFKIDLWLYQDGVEVARDEVSGLNKRKARVVANMAPQENVWFAYQAAAEFSISEGTEIFVLRLESRTRQVCLGDDCPPQPDLVPRRLAAFRW